MLERPPGGTTIRRPAGLMGMSSGVGGPDQQKKGEKDKVSHMEKEQRAHTAVGKEKGHTENPGKKRIKERHLKDYGLYSCWSEVNRAQRKSVKMASTIKV